MRERNIHTESETHSNTERDTQTHIERHTHNWEGGTHILRDTHKNRQTLKIDTKH